MGLDLFATRIKELRTDMSMTQLQFSQLIGVTTATLSGYENDFKKPSIAVLTDIAQKCNISIDWLCGLSDKKSSSNKLETYSEIISFIIKLGDFKDLKMTPWSNIKHDNIYDEQSSSGLTFHDINLVEFIKDWESIKKLHDEKTIDEALYQLWVNQKIDEYNRPINGVPF